jgi:hypothetical protein
MSSKSQVSSVQFEVLHEEIIVHTEVASDGRGFRGEARITGHVIIKGREYGFNKVVPVHFTPKDNSPASPNAGVAPGAASPTGAGERVARPRSLQSFQIAPDGGAIQCLICGMTSYNPNDVREKYCGNCHAFHLDR